jgi:hypothetical protein
VNPDGLVAINVVVGLWKASQLVRSPHRIQLRWVVACFCISTTAFAVAPLTGDGQWGSVSGAGPMVWMWLSYSLMLAMLYCLIGVFVYSAGQGRPAFRQAVREAVPLAVTLIVLTVLASTVPSSLAPADYPQTTLIWFRLVANAYCFYGIVVCVVQMRRYARLARPWLAWGLTVASGGLVLIGLGAGLVATTMVLRLFGLPDWLVMPQAGVLAGNLLFLAGIVAPGAQVRSAAARVWWRHLRDYHRMRPLWTMLHQAFPEETLGRVPASRWGDTLSLRAVNRRFYRRVIECRDGLVRASGWLGVDSAQTEPAAVAAWLREALAGGPRGDADGLTAHPVAMPAEGGLEADVRELVALSRELR